jgi:hypothetical protein
MMVKNIGNLDRIVRLGIAALLIIGILAAWPLTGLVIVFAIVAVVLIVTAIIGMCPIYTLLHKSTKKD